MQEHDLSLGLLLFALDGFAVAVVIELPLADAQGRGRGILR